MDSGLGRTTALSKDERYAKAPSMVENEDPLIDLFKSGLRSDCIVRCKDRQWKLHTIILSSRSSFFSALFNGHFMVRSLLPTFTIALLIESRNLPSREVNLDDNDPEALEVVLRHLYVRSVCSWVRREGRKNYSQETLFQINVAITADQFGVLELAEKVVRYLQCLISSKCWEHEPYARTMTETFIPAIFGKPMCAAPETLKEGIILAVAKAFRGREGPLDQINLVLCQYPELNRKVLEVK